MTAASRLYFVYNFILIFVFFFTKCNKMVDKEINPLILREIILNTRKPIVLKEFPLNWCCFTGGLEEWCKIFDESNGSAVDFERMSKNHSNEPQWERKRKAFKMTTTECLKLHKNEDCDFWTGLNYKRRHELPAECSKGIDFSIFGFPWANDDCTLWLSSSGANTPCHFDSYGCNIVVQIFGRKSWLLFPPETPLTTTRIPYEESSVYCKENFYCPPEDLIKLSEKYKNLAHHIILEPNDVLIVPKHWWHYVEAKDISLSVNAWIPLNNDLEQQIEECIVKYFIENFVKTLTENKKLCIMNPNQLINFSTNEELFNILKYLIKQSLDQDATAKKISKACDYQYLSELKVEKMLGDIKNILQIVPMTSLEFENFLKTNSKRFKKEIENDLNENTLDFMEDILINSFCSPDTIAIIKKEFFKRFKDQAKVEDRI